LAAGETFFAWLINNGATTAAEAAFRINSLLEISFFFVLIG
jgi:hypothetical protein